MNSGITTSNHKLIKHLPLLVTSLLITTGVIFYFTIPGFNAFLQEAWAVLSSNDRPRITAWVNQFGVWGPVIIIVAMIVQIFLVIIPSWGLMVVAVLAYGPIWGGLLSLAATTIAAGVAYLAGNYVGDVVVRGFVGDSTEQKVEGWINQHGFWAVALARLSPFISGDAISLVSGVTNMHFLKFLLATLVGVTPLITAVAYLSHQTDNLKQGFIWLTVGSITLFGLYLLIEKRMNR